MIKKIKNLAGYFVSGVAGALIVLVVLFYLYQYGFVSIVTTENEHSVVSDVADIVEKVNPAVVSIMISAEVPVMEQYFDDPFSRFFGGNSPFSFRIPKYRQKGTEKKEIGGGSGFVISSDGYVVTNAHVVQSEDASYTVFLNNEDSYEAQVVARDEVLDIALLKIEANNLPFLEFGDSDNLKLGQGVIAIGNALGEFRNTVSTGVVSGLSRSIVAGDVYSGSETLENVIQTDAAINPGNSGGPLLDYNGKVVGVNVAVAQGSENIGFSLPANAVEASVRSIIENGRVVRAYLGVRYIPVTDSVKEKNNLTVDYGALVLRGQSPDELAVMPGSPADKAGLEEYDIILEVDGQKVDADHSLAFIIRSKQVGDQVSLRVLHNGEEKEISVTLEENPS